jgi:hypothetical protein
MVKWKHKSILMLFWEKGIYYYEKSLNEKDIELGD